VAFGITNRFKGGKKAHYDAVVERVHPADGLPEGQTHHFAGETDDGFIVVAIWDSRDSWNRFRDETLMPGLQEAGQDGFPEPPDVTEFEVHNERHA
jgi:heme-degrading monooxygenase HmoA